MNSLFLQRPRLLMAVEAGRKPAAATLLALVFQGAFSLAQAADAPPESLDFFEKRIRPVLSEQCYKCHSAKAEKLKGGLLLDSREDILKGGDTGPALVEGDVEKSLLVEAIRWKDKDIAMPPKKPLAPEQVADLEAWIKAGAPWPKEATKTATKKVFDLQKRKLEHWCWRAPATSTPPSLKATAWPTSPIDQFIAAKLEAKNLKPAPDADPRTLIRRASFDLTGLPPTPTEVDAFVADKSADAFAKVVDRLLSSAHFGERWGRHWLDLVRYAETRGHEFDPIIPNAWQYRDYVIRAFNNDVPYDQFAREHLAGDLLTPRLAPNTGANESILGTGFWMLGEEVHSPVDIRQDEADRMDNRLDVMGKTFLALPLGCARCHDHKFDAVSHRDYYAMTGFLISSSYRQARFETLEHHKVIANQLEKLRDSSRASLLKATAEALQSGLAELPKNLLAAASALRTSPSAEPTELKAWMTELREAQKDPRHPLHIFARAAAAKESDNPTAFSAQFSKLFPAEPNPEINPIAPEALVIDYSKPDPKSWLQDGFSFGLHPLVVGAPIFNPKGSPALLGLSTRGAAQRDPIWNSLSVKTSEPDYGKLGDKQRSEQTLRTPDFTLGQERLWYLVKGAGRAYADVNSHLVIAGPLHGALVLDWPAQGAGWRWVEHKLSSYQGHRLHIEFSPVGADDLAIAMVVQSAEKPPLPNRLNPALASALSSSTPASLADLANVSQHTFRTALQSLLEGSLGEANAELADWLLRKSSLLISKSAAEQLQQATAEFISRQAALAGQIRSDSATAPAMFEGNGVDEFLLVRGQAKAPGAQIPRRFLEAIAGPEPMKIASGSGRLELAQAMTTASNPLFSRVIVNRVWHHLFGRGLVPTVDNFGVLGQLPSHPELLDYLATRFSGPLNWSLKKVIREAMLSRTYQMSSQPADPAAELADPDNLLVHRMNVRRLEGEAIRDSILKVSGRLDAKIGGPSVPVHLTDFMDGRGRPAKNGPLDGDGRRSIYIAVRRNFLQPMMLTFDTPIPFNSMGRRNVSNVPAQALILLNDPFVIAQTKAWAKNLPAAESTQERINTMYRQAFGRSPSSDELSQAEAFLRDQAPLYQAKEASVQEQLWADLGHVLFNTKEFIYLN